MRTQAEIKELCKIGYKHGSSNPIDGLDCLTFILYYLSKYKDIQLDISTSKYADDWYDKTPDVYIKGVIEYCDMLAYKPAMVIEEDTILFFSNMPNVPITHAGIYIGNGKILHCLDIRGVSQHKLRLCSNSLRYIGTIKKDKLGDE